MAPAIITTRKHLPQDLENLQNYTWNLTLAYQQLIEKYNKLSRMHWGKKSEKLADREALGALQLEMDALLSQLQEVQEAQQDDSHSDTKEQHIEVTAHRRRRKNTGRNSIPEEMIDDVIVDIDESEKICSLCNKEKSVIDKKEHIVVERIPAQYSAKRYIRLVYGCSGCKDTTSVAEPVHLPIAKGLAGPFLLTFVALSKYMYHLPLYRIQRQIFHESRIWFTRTTLVSWVRQISGILERVYAQLLEHYRLSKIKHNDDTPFQVKRNGAYRQAYMWSGVSGDARVAVFYYHKHRSGSAALSFLDGSQPGDYLMVDDCPSYNKAIKHLKLLDQRCMAHVRRKFKEAFDSGHYREINKKVLVKIGQLYKLERFAAKHDFTLKQRAELRDKYSRQVMDKLKNILENPERTILPQSDTGGAIRHILKNWTQVTRFLDAGDLPIDNSINERIIRPFAIGRNNWMQAGSENGARWMAILYTIITTCKLNNVDPQKYLEDVLMRLPIRPTGADISDLLPVKWYQKQNGGKLPEQKLYPSEI